MSSHGVAANATSAGRNEPMGTRRHAPKADKPMIPAIWMRGPGRLCFVHRPQHQARTGIAGPESGRPVEYDSNISTMTASVDAAIGGRVIHVSWPARRRTGGAGTRCNLCTLRVLRVHD